MRASNQTRRIAVLLPDLRGGGVERMRLNLAAEWLALGCKVDLIVLEKSGELLSLVPEGAELVDLQAPRIRSVLWPLARCLRDRRPSVLLVAMWPLTVLGIIATKIARAGNTVAVSDHITLSKQYSDWGWPYRALLKGTVSLIYPWADVRIAVSEGIVEDMAKLSGISPDHYVVIYNPAATKSRDCMGGEASKKSTNDGSKMILSVGTLKYQKNHELLIDAFARLSTSQSAKLTILGEGDRRAYLERLILEKNLQDRVSLPGFVVDPGPYYEGADLFVLSSRYEGFGNVLIEAMEHGVPVVSTDCPSGPREILADGEYGVLVPTDDAAALAEAIDASLRKSHDQSALRRRALDYSAEKISIEYLDVLLPDWRRGGMQ